MEGFACSVLWRIGYAARFGVAAEPVPLASDRLVRGRRRLVYKRLIEDLTGGKIG